MRDLFGWAITFLVVALNEALPGLSGIARGEAKRRLKELKRRSQTWKLAPRNPSPGAPGDEPAREIL